MYSIMKVPGTITEMLTSRYHTVMIPGTVMLILHFVTEDDLSEVARTWPSDQLLRIAAEDYALSSVHGGCAKENIASARAMEKSGMVQYGTEENGDPLFRFTAKEKAEQ